MMLSSYAIDIISAIDIDFAAIYLLILFHAFLIFYFRLLIIISHADYASITLDAIFLSFAAAIIDAADARSMPLIISFHCCFSLMPCHLLPFSLMFIADILLIDYFLHYFDISLSMLRHFRYYFIDFAISLIDGLRDTDFLCHLPPFSPLRLFFRLLSFAIIFAAFLRFLFAPMPRCSRLPELFPYARCYTHAPMLRHC